MNQLIKDILSEIREKHKDKNEWWNTKLELERILDSQFKVLRNSIEERDLRIINLIYLGKVKPSRWLKDHIDSIRTVKQRKEYYKDKPYVKKVRDKKHNSGMVELPIQQQESEVNV